MSEPFIAEVRIWGLNYAPRGWAFCDGQLQQISQNTALFSLVGTTYGGDGRTTFGIPNMKNRVPMHPGRGPGLTQKYLGQFTGSMTTTLDATQIPTHTHSGASASKAAGTTEHPEGQYIGYDISETEKLYTETDTPVAMADNALHNTGGSQEHYNLQPFSTLNFCIALAGTYPSRN